MTVKLLVDTCRPWLAGGRYRCLTLDIEKGCFWDVQRALRIYDVKNGTHLSEQLGKYLFTGIIGVETGVEAPELNPNEILPKTWGVCVHGEIERVASEPECLAGDGLCRADEAFRFDMLGWFTERFDDAELFGKVFQDLSDRAFAARQKIISMYLDDFRRRVIIEGKVQIHWKTGETVTVCPVRSGHFEDEPKWVPAEVY